MDLFGLSDFANGFVKWYNFSAKVLQGYQES